MNNESSLAYAAHIVSHWPFCWHFNNLNFKASQCRKRIWIKCWTGDILKYESEMDINESRLLQNAANNVILDLIDKRLWSNDAKHVSENEVIVRAMDLSKRLLCPTKGSFHVTLPCIAETSALRRFLCGLFKAFLCKFFSSKTSSTQLSFPISSWLALKVVNSLYHEFYM